MEDQEDLMDKGYEFMGEKQWEKAIEQLQICTTNKKQSGEAFIQKGYCELQLGKYMNSIESCNQALLLDSNNATALNHIGMAYQSLGKYDEAFDYCNQALLLNPTYINALNNKGMILFSLEKYDEAIDYYNQVLQFNNNDATALNSKGMVYKSQGKYNEALDYFNQALQLNSDKRDDILNNKGMVFDSLGKQNEASDCYNQVLELNPNNVTALKSKGKLLEQQGKSKEALESYELASKLEPNNLISKDKIIILTNLLNKPENLAVILLFNKNSVESYQRMQQFFELQNQQRFIDSIIKKFANISLVSVKIKANNCGGFGMIHQGMYNNEEVIIKVVELNQNTTDDTFIHLLREIAILAYSDHPNIARIKAVYFNPAKINDKYEVQIIYQRYFMDLHSVLFQTKKPINKKGICYQILKALQYIHKAGLVHLNLKPLKLMFCDESFTDIVIIGFGISEIYRENQGIKLAGMTISYCPPEMRFNDLSMVSPKSDIFSFGIILYELITERKAWSKYQNQGQKEIYNMIRNTNFSFFSENTPTGINKIDQLIANCMQRKAAKRPSASEALEIIKKFEFEF